MTLWRRYLFFRVLKSFILILFSIFILFVFIDMATRGGKMLGKSFFPSSETLFYYVYQFSNFLHFFFPLSFLLASIQVLLDLNTHQELVALQMGGLSQSKLLAPFFKLGLFLFLLLLSNYEWVSPKTLHSAHEYEKAYAHHKKRALREHLRTLSLEDGSELIFQQFDEEKKELFDVFWRADSSTIWHMKFLQINPSKGLFVDRFEKNSSGWAQAARFQELDFPQMIIDEKKALAPFILYERRALSKLVQDAWSSGLERPKVLSHLFYKLFSSIFPFFSLFAIAPVCFTFSRKKNTFMILACTLFGFLSAMMLLDGLLVLGENQVIAAWLAFGVPLAASLAFIYPSLKRLS